MHEHTHGAIVARMSTNDPLPFMTHAGGSTDLVSLDPDHPGFKDKIYRQRREEIARLALNYRPDQPVPFVDYTPQEHAVWNEVHTQLFPLHKERACQEINDLQRVLPLSPSQIPQIKDINQRLKNTSGFRIEPVAGLVVARTFMRYLGNQIFLSTQYMRHHSRPLYTPEPDIIHELVGHAATLAHPAIAELSRVLGAAVASATELEIKRLDRIYWYTLEFGLVEEKGQIKAFGAGLLSSISELKEFDSHASLQRWDLDKIAETDFDPTSYQDTLFVAPSFTHLICDVTAWVRTGRWRSM